MKFKWVAPVAALALAGCGDGSDFSVQVNGDAGSAMESLASASNGSGFAGISPAMMTADADSLTFQIAAADGYDPAEIRMDFVQEGQNTTIDVAVDVPQVPMGGNEYLSEWKVEQELRKNLRAWARQYGKVGSAASTSEIALTLSLVAVAAQRVDLNDVFMAGGYDAGAWENELAGWGSDTSTPDTDYDSDYASDSGWSDEDSYSDGGWGAES